MLVLVDPSRYKDASSQKAKTWGELLQPHSTTCKPFSWCSNAGCMRRTALLQHISMLPVALCSDAASSHEACTPSNVTCFPISVAGRHTDLCHCLSRFALVPSSFTPLALPVVCWIWHQPILCFDEDVCSSKLNNTWLLKWGPASSFGFGRINRVIWFLLSTQEFLVEAFCSVGCGV